MKNKINEKYLREIPYTNGMYFILDNNVYDINKIMCNDIIYDGIKKTIRLNWFNGDMYYDFGLILLLTRMKIVHPLYVVKKYKIYYDNNYKNIFYTFSDGPIECLEKPGFYHIPNYPMYVINTNGLIYSLRNGIFLKWFTIKPPKNNYKNIKNGYYAARALDYSLKFNKVYRHRMLCLAFKPLNINPDKLYVNHIDGIPGNDILDNIEWITPKENLLHALKNGLMPNSAISIDMMNLDTKSVITFNSIADAANYLNWTHGKVYKRIGIKKVYPDKIVFKKHSSEWPTFDDVVTTMGCRRKITSVNVLTNEVIEHLTIMHASAHTGVSTTSITERARLNNGKPSKNIKFYFSEEYNNN